MARSSLLLSLFAHGLLWGSGAVRRPYENRAWKGLSALTQPDFVCLVFLSGEENSTNFGSHKVPICFGL